MNLNNLNQTLQNTFTISTTPTTNVDSQLGEDFGFYIEGSMCFNTYRNLTYRKENLLSSLMNKFNTEDYNGFLDDSLKLKSEGFGIHDYECLIMLKNGDDCHFIPFFKFLNFVWERYKDKGYIIRINLGRTCKNYYPLMDPFFFRYSNETDSFSNLLNKNIKDIDKLKDELVEFSNKYDKKEFYVDTHIFICKRVEKEYKWIYEKFRKTTVKYLITKLSYNCSESPDLFVKRLKRSNVDIIIGRGKIHTNYNEEFYSCNMFIDPPIAANTTKVINNFFNLDLYLQKTHTLDECVDYCNYLSGPNYFKYWDKKLMKHDIDNKQLEIILAYEDIDFPKELSFCSNVEYPNENTPIWFISKHKNEPCYIHCEPFFYFDSSRILRLLTLQSLKQNLKRGKSLIIYPDIIEGVDIQGIR